MTPSQKQEQQIAKYLGGRVQANSGGTRFGGGDVHTKQFLIEAKTPMSEKKSVPIPFDWVSKSKEQAFEQGLPYSAIAIRFDPQGPDYYLIDSKLMKMLVEHLEGE